MVPRNGHTRAACCCAADPSGFEENEPFNVDDVIDEVFDMLNSENQRHITLKDLEVSRVRRMPAGVASGSPPRKPAD